jgi:hypothetical protein
MEPKGSLPCLQEPATGACPDPDQFSPVRVHAGYMTVLGVVSNQKHARNEVLELRIRDFLDV